MWIGAAFKDLLSMLLGVRQLVRWIHVFFFQIRQSEWRWDWVHHGVEVKCNLSASHFSQKKSYSGPLNQIKQKNVLHISKKHLLFIAHEMSEGY